MRTLIIALFALLNSALAEESILTIIDSQSVSAKLGKSIFEDDARLHKAAEQLKSLPQPWTIDRVIAWHDDPSFTAQRASFLWLLAASKDERGKLTLEKYVERVRAQKIPPNEFPLHMEAIRAVVTYTDSGPETGGTEQFADAAIKWLAERKRTRGEKP